MVEDIGDPRDFFITTIIQNKQKKEKTIMPKEMKEHKITVRFSETEYETIRNRMKNAGVINQSAFIRAMVLGGYVLHLDLLEIRELIRLLGIITNNINQIAKRENAGGHIYETELDEIKENQNQLWQLLRKNLTKLENFQCPD